MSALPVKACGEGWRDERSILLINKHPLTAAAVTLAVPGPEGHGVICRLDAANAKTGPGKGETVLLSESIKLTIPAYAAVAISHN